MSSFLSSLSVVANMFGIGRWVGRVALVTGASTGVGSGICKELVKQGMRVVGCARNHEQLQQLADSKELKNAGGELIPIRCNLSREAEIHTMFDTIRKEMGRLDVCINNAAFNIDAPLLSARTAEDWRNIMEVNVIALCICSREAVKLMEENGIDGQIIQIGCITGHKFPDTSLPGLNMYYASKSAVRSLTEGLRREVRQYANPTIRVASITPGAVESELAARCLSPGIAKAFYSRVKCLQPEDIADAVTYILETPQHVEVNDIVLQPIEYTL